MNPYDSPRVKEMYAHALEFATKAHEGQVRQHTGEPYITHPVRVAALARRFDVGERYRTIAQSAALLHDVIEDCGVTRAEIVDEFGHEVAYGVWSLTDCVGRGVAEAGVDNRAKRKATDLEWLSKCNPLVRALKLLDCADNLGNWPVTDGFLDLMLRETAALRGALGRGLDRLMMQEVLDHFDETWLRVSGARWRYLDGIPEPK